MANLSGKVGVAMSLELASAIVWLCCDEASFVTGVTVPIDGGPAAR